MPVYSLTILAAALMVVWVYHQDSREREPWSAVIVALVSGFGAMWLLGIADDFAIRSLQLGQNRIFPKAAVVALIEEGGKLLTVLALALFLLRKHFNDPMDGMIYGRIAGVGMAVQESLLYLSLSPPTIETLGVEIVRLFAHSLMAGVVGFAIGLGAHPSRRREYYPRLTLLCLALSTTMHFGWNTIAYSRQTGLYARLMPMVLMLSMMMIWHWFRSIAMARSREVFAGQC